MSNNKVLFNFLFKSNYNTKIKTQQLYIIYNILHKYDSTLNFNQFYLHVCLFTKFFKKANITYLFLISLLLIKTKHIKLLFSIYNTDFIISNKDTTVLKKTSYTLTSFWNKFKKLKRPVTEFSYSDYYISTYKSKIIKYSKSGFLILFDSLYLVKFKSGELLKNLVQINKPLLTTPKYSSSSINKYLSLNLVQSFEFQFLRKNKVYNKGRYSRCRQNYRTGVYMCMYLSVVSIFGLYYWFYKFSFNFTYLWWIFISFVASFFLPKIIKYRLYEPTTLIFKFFSLFKWFSVLLKSFLR